MNALEARPDVTWKYPRVVDVYLEGRLVTMELDRATQTFVGFETRWLLRACLACPLRLRPLISSCLPTKEEDRSHTLMPTPRGLARQTISVGPDKEGHLTLEDIQETIQGARAA